MLYCVATQFLPKNTKQRAGKALSLRHQATTILATLPPFTLTQAQSALVATHSANAAKPSAWVAWLATNGHIVPATA